MSTRLKKPSRSKQLGITVLLIAFQVYLGVSALTGQFGVTSQMDMVKDIAALQVQSDVLDAQITTLKHRIALYDPKRLDPDILTEQARAQLSLADPRDKLIITEKPSDNFPAVKNAY